MNKEDFTKEEYAFFNEMIDYRKNYVKKYKHGCSNKFNCNKPIETLRLILQPFDDNLDHKYYTYFLKNRDEYENFYKLEYSKYEINRYCHPKSEQINFAIMLKHNNEFIGSVALNRMNAIKYHLEYFIYPQHRKNGYAYEAVQEILKRAFDNKLLVLQDTIRYSVYIKKTLNIKCIYARTDSNNIGSIKLLEKLGFQKDGMLKYDNEMYGKFYDSFVFTLEK